MEFISNSNPEDYRRVAENTNLPYDTVKGLVYRQLPLTAENQVAIIELMRILEVKIEALFEQSKALLNHHIACTLDNMDQAQIERLLPTVHRYGLSVLDDMIDRWEGPSNMPI